eukprot:5397078-Lingulodinium_polyedra.AAC.1
MGRPSGSRDALPTRPVGMVRGPFPLSLPPPLAEPLPKPRASSWNLVRSSRSRWPDDFRFRARL